MPENDYINKIFTSCNDGQFKVLGKSIERKGYYVIQFIDTGSIVEARIDGIKSGHIKDPKNHSLLGETFYTSKGQPYTIIADKGYKGRSKIYEVRFEYTQTIAEFRRENIINGYVKDPTAPTKCGVAYNDNMPTKDEFGNTIKEYSLWSGMINRCYNENQYSYRLYGGVGVTVCDRWLHYKNFYYDIRNLPGYENWVLNPDMYHLDKDLLQQNIPKNQMVYSPTTCMFIPATYNVAEPRYRASTLPLGVNMTERGNYFTKVRKDGKQVTLGTFQTPESAAVMRDWYIDTMHLPLKKNYIEPPMTIYESLQYKIPPRGMHKKQLCRIVDKD